MNPDFRSIIGLEPSLWMMSPVERFTVIGILEMLHPKTAIEFGCAAGGLTELLSKYCDAVTTVDIDTSVYKVASRYRNVEALCMSTADAAQKILKSGRSFDLAVIDADHSRSGVQTDLENALQFAKVIILHDTYYPPCRRGMMDVLKSKTIYYNLELVPGRWQSDGLWGGIGLVLPEQKLNEGTYVTPHRSLYSFLYGYWVVHQFIGQISKLPQRLRQLLIKVMGR